MAAANNNQSGNSSGSGSDNNSGGSSNSNQGSNSGGNSNSNANNSDQQAPETNQPNGQTASGTSTDDITPSTTPQQAAAKQAQQDKRTAENRAKEIDAMDLTDDEKEVLKLYDKGVHVFQIAKTVFKFANKDTVGQVMLTIRKEHADDYQQVEDINSTKGYTGIGVGA